MTFTLLFTLLTCTATTVLLPCNADILPPPTRLSYKWLDPFSVNVSWSWKKPSNLPEDCEVKFEYQPGGKIHDGKRTPHRYFIDSFFTEETNSSHCSYNIHATSDCDGWSDSTYVNATIRTSKPRAKVVEDFKCFLDRRGMNCSWIPVNQSLNVTISYRKCGHTSEELLKSSKECDRYYSGGGRVGCYLSVGDETEICINAATVAESISFKPSLVIHSPKLTIKPKGRHLHLSWTPPEVGKNCDWIIDLCPRQCDKTICLKITEVKDVFEEQIPYNESHCQYQSRFRTSKRCPAISSDFGDIVTYEVDRDETLTVVAIVIPLILSVCVILSCYCFRKHKAIICPNIPDPSAIFKEMLMNGNREFKPSTGNLYTPVPEPTESCRIALEKENGVSQQNL